MTEEEWATGRNFDALRDFFYRPASGARKRRLWACACLRLVWDRLPDVRFRQAVETAERFADGACKLKELNRAYRNYEEAAARVRARAHSPLLEWDLSTAVDRVSRKGPELRWVFPDTLVTVAATAADGAGRAALVDRQLGYLRDVFGSPFRPVAFDPAWRTGTATALAAQMYESRDFGAMPILADALQDAGCDDADVLSHCREPGEHVRGCWVVDLVLGKT